MFNAYASLQIIKHSSYEDSDSKNIQQSSANLWHLIFGHILFSKLKHIQGIHFNTNKVDSAICVSCSLAKHTYLPYTRNEYSCKVPFGFIHMDIWSPYRISTHGQYRYFFTIVDDCTRATWTYLLKYKSQALATLQIHPQSVSTHC